MVAGIAQGHCPSHYRNQGPVLIRWFSRASPSPVLKNRLKGQSETVLGTHLRSTACMLACSAPLAALRAVQQRDGPIGLVRLLRVGRRCLKIVQFLAHRGETVLGGGRPPSRAVILLLEHFSVSNLNELAKSVGISNYKLHLLTCTAVHVQPPRPRQHGRVPPRRKVQRRVCDRGFSAMTLQPRQPKPVFLIGHVSCTGRPVCRC